MTDARTLLDATRLAHALHIAESHCSENAYGCVAWKSFQKRAAKVIETYVSLAGSYPAAEADILRERVAALEGAARRVTSAQVYEAPGDPCQGLDVGFVRALRLLYEVVTSPAPTPATDPRQRKENVGGPAVAAYFATPATDEARCGACEANISDGYCDEHEPSRQPTPEPECHLCWRTKDEHAARTDLLHTFTPEPK